MSKKKTDTQYYSTNIAKMRGIYTVKTTICITTVSITEIVFQIIEMKFQLHFERV